MCESDLRNSYVVMNFKFAHKNNLLRVNIDSHVMSDFEKEKETIDIVIRFNLNIEENTKVNI